MKTGEIINNNRDAIRDEMVTLYRTVLECGGNIQYKLYVWDDGELETLEAPQGDTSWLQPREHESRGLHYIATIDSPYFDPWDYSYEPRPEDDAEAEEMEEEIIEWLVDEFETDGADEIIDQRIEDAEQEERYF